jgi:hypothetical protein
MKRMKFSLFTSTAKLGIAALAISLLPTTNNALGSMSEKQLRALSNEKTNISVNLGELQSGITLLKLTHVGLMYLDEKNSLSLNQKTLISGQLSVEPLTQALRSRGRPLVALRSPQEVLQPNANTLIALEIERTNLNKGVFLVNTRNLSGKNGPLAKYLSNLPACDTLGISLETLQASTSSLKLGLGQKLQDAGINI